MDLPDSSGLVGAGTEPWEPGTTPAGSPDAPTGTVPGPATGARPPAALRPGASGPDAFGVQSTDGVVSSPAVMPPGMPPIGPLAPSRDGATGAERSDASGLLSGDDVPWQDGTATAAPDAAGGAPRGGAQADAGAPVSARDAVDAPGGPSDGDGLTADRIVDFPPATAQGDDDGRHRQFAMVPPMVPPAPPGRTGGRDETPWRSRAGEALEEGDSWMPQGAATPDTRDTPAPAGESPQVSGAGHVSTPPLPDDRVPVVRLTGHEEDVESWDSDPLPWGDDDALPAVPRSEDLPGRESLSRFGEDHDAAPGASGLSMWRPARPADGATPVADTTRPLQCTFVGPTAEELEAIQAERRATVEANRRRFSGEPDEDEELDDEDGQAERAAVDLLRQDDAAWGGSGSGTGVLG
ncbi:hypothetical protein [Actinoplanes sp. NPDC049118]|uniref:hypothetical protein n=1 Tax=Actinoplanes sp. NPDC049118 TaxID=3155769 RepID=UPI0033EB4E77